MPSPRPLLSKICGLTRPEDVLLCQSLGVNFTGFIFVPASPRYITPAAAAALPRGSGFRTGVFAGASLKSIRKIARQASLDYIQLHGGEDERFCRALGPDRVIRVFQPQNLSRAAFLEELDRFAPVAAYFLFDSGSGSGRTLDFRILADLESPRPWFLAGGLGPQTLPLALAACTPDGVDCNSRLESAPGVKDPALLRRIMNSIRGS